MQEFDVIQFVSSFKTFLETLDGSSGNKCLAKNPD